MKILLAFILLASCAENPPPSPDAGACSEWPTVPAETCAGVYQFDLRDCAWSCSTWGFDGGVQ